MRCICTFFSYELTPEFIDERCRSTTPTQTEDRQLSRYFASQPQPRKAIEGLCSSIQEDLEAVESALCAF